MTAQKMALVVDDNRINRVLLVRMLSKEGWATAEAEDGEAALAWLSANKADMALIDISMPKLSGEDVCRRVRVERLGGDGIRLVAYTAHAMPEQRAHFITCGFDSILTKPVSRENVTALLVELGLG